jgi:hypothetical protein
VKTPAGGSKKEVDIYVLFESAILALAGRNVKYRMIRACIVVPTKIITSVGIANHTSYSMHVLEVGC